MDASCLYTNYTILSAKLSIQLNFIDANEDKLREILDQNLWINDVAQYAPLLVHKWINVKTQTTDRIYDPTIDRTFCETHTRAIYTSENLQHCRLFSSFN